MTMEDDAAAEERARKSHAILAGWEEPDGTTMPCYHCHSGFTGAEIPQYVWGTCEVCGTYHALGPIHSTPCVVDMMTGGTARLSVMRLAGKRGYN